MSVTMVGQRRKFQVKYQNNVTNYKFLAKYFYQHFQIFSIFIYNESLPMKSYQLFKICKHFDQEREITLTQHSTRKEKLRKVGLCFMTGYFVKSFNVINNHFFCIGSSFAAQFLLLYIRMMQGISKGGVRNWKQLGMANYNIYLKIILIVQ